MSSFKDTWYHDWDSNPHSAEQKHRSLKSLLLTARPQHLQSTQRLHFRYTLNTSGSELDPDPGQSLTRIRVMMGPDWVSMIWNLVTCRPQTLSLQWGFWDARWYQTYHVITLFLVRVLCNAVLSFDSIEINVNLIE